MLLAVLLHLRTYRNVLIRGVRNHLNSSCDTLLLDLHSPANPRKQFDNFSTKQTKKDLLSCLEPGPEMLERFRLMSFHRTGYIWHEPCFESLKPSYDQEGISFYSKIWEIFYQSDRGKNQYCFIASLILILRRFCSLLRHRYVRSSAVWMA